MKRFEVRGAFDYDVDKASAEAGLSCPESENMTQQQFAEECDINTIVKRFGLTGEVPVNYRPPLMEDFVEVTDYHSAMNAVIAAQAKFMQLPPELRSRFGNDPAMLIDFLNNDKNRDEALRLGILAPPKEADRSGGELPAAT